MLDIVIVIDFLGPLNGTFNSRFLYLADMLAKGNNVEVITSDFHHGAKDYFNHEIEKHDFPITMLHEPSYKKNVCLKRFYSHHIWGKNVGKYLANRKKKPDVIYCAIPTLTAAYEAAKYCEKNNIRFIIDIQDLWPEAFRMVFRVPVISSIIFTPFKLLANNIYKRADAICAVSETYCNRALSVNRKCKTGTVVYLGTDLANFDKNAKENPVLEKKAGEIWLAYCGSLSTSYDLKTVFDALSLLADKKLRFIIMGDGEKRKEFEAYAHEKSVQATFTGRLPYDQMCGMLCACDITVNPIAHMAAQSIINKHGDYAMSGLPVINTQENQEYRDLVEKYQMGFNVGNNDAEDMADKMRTLITDEKLRNTMGANARRCAEERFDRKATYDLLKTHVLTSVATLGGGTTE